MGLVVAFGRESNQVGKTAPSIQLDLFRDQLASAGIVSFVDVGDINAERWLEIFSRNCVRGIIDFRRNKILAASAIQHRAISDYIEQYRIVYKDLSEEQVSPKNFMILADALGDVLKRGFCLVLFNQSDAKFDVGLLRWIFSDIIGARAEIPFNSL
jgi:hypothetical protein